jgi:hypothetical protein
MLPISSLTLPPVNAVNLGLDWLHRYVHGLPVAERTDFKRV